MLGQMRGSAWLNCVLLYGSRLRLREALFLRGKNVDLERRALLVRSGKGDQGRVVTLEALVPDALARKYPRAPLELGSKFLVRVSAPGTGLNSGEVRRYHLRPCGVPKPVRQAMAQTLPDATTRAGFEYQDHTSLRLSPGESKTYAF